MEHIRKLELKDTKAMFDLAAYAFNSEVSDERKKRFDWIVEHSEAYGYIEGEQLTSQLLSTPFAVDFHGSKYKMGGVGCVSSYPEYRRQGSITALMRRLLSDLAKEKTALSYLSPFSYPFYRRYGYEQLFEQIIYRIASTDWPKTTAAESSVYREDWSHAKSVIAEIYAEELVKHPGALVREDWWLEYKFAQGNEFRFAIAKSKEGQPLGYLVYKVTSEEFTINEWKALNKDAYSALAGFIGSHSGTTRQFYYEKGFIGENLSYLMPAPVVEMKLVPYMMGRIVDFKIFIASYPFQKYSTEYQFYLEIVDEFAPWNAGFWQLKVKDGTAVLNQIEDKVFVEGKRVLSSGIQGWTQLLMGYRTGAELNFHEILSGSREMVVLLDQLIPDGKPVLEDYF
ncbi:GNAT family N-acetyltransferase [Enterococcus sp. BWB1-3]|uniref:GNAT family N-acetyltransferase n=1 Tax=Enterococcus sp. BWB1-3 TaxID=2787713 RepID=UPI0019230863|nr:GNAT family N-acetyltransferase [Enterococcus sp. BWB1-3]MBL1227899.1 GNAT family N-acetyltransferase [Enterococcus sp. BWB1-3]